MADDTVMTVLEEVEEAAQIAEHNGGLRLNEWEERFLDSIRSQVDRGRRVTVAQRRVLYKLHGRI